MATFAFLFMWIATTVFLCLPIAIIFMWLMPAKFNVQFGSDANLDRLEHVVGLVSTIVGLVPAIHSARATIRMAG